MTLNSRQWYFEYFRGSASRIFRYQRLVFFLSLAMSCQEDWSHRLTPVPAIPTPGATGSSTRNWPRECYFNTQFWLILWNQTILKETKTFCSCFSVTHVSPLLAADWCLAVRTSQRRLLLIRSVFHPLAPVAQRWKISAAPTSHHLDTKYR